MTKKQAQHLIHDHGVQPSRLGALAHRILDWTIMANRVWCITPRRYWHEATARELTKLHVNRMGMPA